jgi:hypothetical protein
MGMSAEWWKKLLVLEFFCLFDMYRFLTSIYILKSNYVGSFYYSYFDSAFGYSALHPPIVHRMEWNYIWCCCVSHHHHSWHGVNFFASFMPWRESLRHHPSYGMNLCTIIHGVQLISTLSFMAWSESLHNHLWNGANLYAIINSMLLISVVSIIVRDSVDVQNIHICPDGSYGSHSHITQLL